MKRCLAFRRGEFQTDWRLLALLHRHFPQARPVFREAVDDDLVSNLQTQAIVSFSAKGNLAAIGAFDNTAPPRTPIIAFALAPVLSQIAEDIDLDLRVTKTRLIEISAGKARRVRFDNRSSSVNRLELPLIVEDDPHRTRA